MGRQEQLKRSRHTSDRPPSTLDTQHSERGFRDTIDEAHNREPSTGEQANAEPELPVQTARFDFGAISILPPDSASLATRHTVMTPTGVWVQASPPQWQGGGDLPIQRQTPAAPADPNVAVIDIPAEDVPPEANQVVEEADDIAPADGGGQEAVEPGPDPDRLVQEMVGEVQRVVPASMPSTEALVLANSILDNNANLDRAILNDAGGGAEAANPPRRPGLMSRIGSKVKGFFSGAKAKGLRLADKLAAEVRGLWEALTPSALTKKKAANVTKLITGTVAPIGVAIGGFLSKVGVRIGQMLEPAKDLAGAAGHVLSPVGLGFSVLSFILSVRSAFSSHKHFKNLERLAKAVVAANQEEEIDPNVANDMSSAIQFAAGQKSRKRDIKILSSVGGALGVSGGTIGLLAAFGVALSVAVPFVGIALAALGGLTAAGIFLYRVYRKNQKEKGKKALKVGLTRERAAQIIHDAAVRVATNKPASMNEPATVRQALQELKIDLSMAAGPGGYDLIMRKLKS